MFAYRRNSLGALLHACLDHAVWCPMHVVVVDPSRVALKIIAGLLEPQGHTLSCFSDSREAVVFVTDTPSVDVVITSLEVRPMSGLEVCWSVRTLAETRRPIHVIAMSSLQNARNLSEALDSGADDFIGKPPVAEELFARLRAAERIIRLQRELIRLADTDTATGLLNRRAFRQRLNERTHLQEQHYGSLVVFSVDSYSRMLDEHGRAFVEEVIGRIADEIRTMSPVAARLEDDEFGLALTEVVPVEAEHRVVRLKQRLGQMRFSGRKGPVRVTCSVGVSAWSDNEAAEAVLARAGIARGDAALAGGDCVITAQAELVLARSA